MDVNFQYDALGRRVARTGTGGSVVYVQHDQQTIADYPVSGVASTPTYRYVYASYIDEPVVRKAAGTGGTIHYYHRNQQYSITAMTTSTGAVAERYAYTAYGQPTILNASGSVLTSSAIGNRYTYTGREWDETLGIHHFRARWMSPLAGRFLGRDPIGYLDGPNFMEFLTGNPFKFVDPTGNFKDKAECEKAIANKKRPEKNGVTWPKKCRILPEVVCEECKGNETLGSTTLPNNNPHNSIKITVCWNNANNNTIDRILRHEFIHAVDICMCPKIITDEGFFEFEQDVREDLACMEVRAYSLDGGCDKKPTEDERKDCVRKGAIRSVASSLGISEEEAKKYVDAVLEQCYLQAPKSIPFTVPNWPRGDE
ncbi:MAG: RHS repeat-associated core domain-containing protein [Pirellula sp.]